MPLTKGRINREGRIVFHDASLAIWEEGLNSRMSWEERESWERQFKRDVFARIVQTLNRLGWSVGPQHYIATGNNNRFCQKGDLNGDLSINGRNIEFKMFQSVNCPTRPDHEGRYEWDKEGAMPYVVRLEMERTRRRIRDYLCGVMEGYEFDDSRGGRHWRQKCRTAMASIEASYAESWHFKGDWPAYLDANNGLPYNRKSADGAMLEHGQRVWFFDRKGRINTGTALYNINNMWWVVTGRYDYTNEACFSLYTRLPENHRVKRNAGLRRKRLEGLLADAVKAMHFERASVLRDLLFPSGEQLFVVLHEGHGTYHRAGFSGYAKDVVDAGKFTANEVKGWAHAPNKVIPLEAA